MNFTAALRCYAYLDHELTVCAIHSAQSHMKSPEPLILSESLCPGRVKLAISWQSAPTSKALQWRQATYEMPRFWTLHIIKHIPHSEGSQSSAAAVLLSSSSDTRRRQQPRERGSKSSTPVEDSSTIVQLAFPSGIAEARGTETIRNMAYRVPKSQPPNHSPYMSNLQLVGGRMPKTGMVSS